MANLNISAQKGIETAVMAAVASIITELAVAGLLQLGIHVESAELKLAFIALLTGATQAVSNWYKHRVKKEVKNG